MPVDLSGQPLPQSPKWTGSATAVWTQDIGSNGNNWYVRWDEIYRSSSYSNLEGVAAEPLGLGNYPFLMPCVLGRQHPCRASTSAPR